MSGSSFPDSVGLMDVDLPSLLTGLARAKITVAAAESLTGGLLTAMLTAVPGASEVVRGALVVYATDLKHSLAGVDADLLASRGPVDPDVALALARGVRSVCGATVGVGLTGVAGPDQQHGIAVGTWYVAISRDSFEQVLSNHSGQVDLRTMPDGTKQEPERNQVRMDAVRAAIGLLAALI